MEHISSNGARKPEYALTGEEKGNSIRRKSSAVNAEILAGEMYDERYGGTKRGLKSRHAQMIALGGS